jgi:hypothetical protein
MDIRSPLDPTKRLLNGLVFKDTDFIVSSEGSADAE